MKRLHGTRYSQPVAVGTVDGRRLLGSPAQSVVQVSVQALGYLVLVMLPLLLPAAGWTVPTWINFGPQGGQVDAFAQCPTLPDRIYVNPSGFGIFRSDDRGGSWTRVVSDLPMDETYDALAVSPVDEDVLLLAGTSGVMMRSTDAGVSWTQITGAWAVPATIAIDPSDPDLVLLASPGYGSIRGVHRSTDGGLTWAPPATDIYRATQVAFQPGSRSVALVGAEYGIFRSTDGGETWSAVYTEGPGETLYVSFCRDSPTRVWATSTNSVLTSTDGGLTFAPSAGQPQCPSYGCWMGGIAAHPTDPLHALVLEQTIDLHWPPSAVDPRLVRTTDGGVTWTEAYSYDDAGESWILTYDVQDANRVYVAAAGGIGAGSNAGILRSLDGGQSWFGSMNGIRAMATLGLDHDAVGTIWFRPKSRPRLYRRDAIWTEVGSSDLRDPRLFYVTPGAAGVLHEAGNTYSMDTADPWHAWSTDGGVSWTQTALPQTTLAEFVVEVVAYGTGTTFYVWTTAPALNRTFNGSTYVTLSPGFRPNGAAVHPGNAMRQFTLDASSPGAVRLTTDGGASWELRSSGLPSNPGTELVMNPADANHLVTVYQTAGAWETTDAGLSWTAMPSPPPSSLVIAADWDPFTGRVFFATWEDGVWITDLGFVTDGLPTRDLVAVDYVRSVGVVVLGTEHAGVYGLELPPAPVDTPAVPLARTGLRVHPTPFAGSLTVELDLPAAGVPTSVVVFDVAGRRVATLLPAGTRAGSQTVTWNGRTADGAPAAPGAYFVSARIGGERRIARTVLVR